MTNVVRSAFFGLESVIYVGKKRDKQGVGVYRVAGCDYIQLVRCGVVSEWDIIVHYAADEGSCDRASIFLNDFKQGRMILQRQKAL